MMFIFELDVSRDTAISVTYVQAISKGFNELVIQYSITDIIPWQIEK